MNSLALDLGRLVGPERVKTDLEDLHAYSSDAIHYYTSHLPDAVVLPESSEEISRVVKYAGEHSIPVTPRGAGSGLSAGCTPIRGGLVLDLKRMNRVLEINRGNLTAQVEPGVVTANFHRAVEKQRLFYPPDPQSMDVCTLGGNVATRAGGPRGVKYGATGNYVLGLEVVLPDGEIIRTGGNSVKQSAGYDLTRLLTGSEGTLGVISRITLRLLPLPQARRTVIVVCGTADLAANLVSEIIARGTLPAKLEYLLKGPIALMNRFLPQPLPLDGEAFLLIELDGTPSQVIDESNHVESICRELQAKEVRVVEDAGQAESYWQARKNLNPITMAIFKKMINEDVSVPRDRIPEMVRAIQEISAAVGVGIGFAGHAGDGNIHPAILLTELSEAADKKADLAVERIIKKGLELGGTISGEHGIGLHKARFLPWELGPVQVELMKRIKQAFDPKNIMNPGKIWPEGGLA